MTHLMGEHAGQEGFTLVEVMMAATVLLLGVLGVGAMLGQAATATWSTKAREGAVALQREIVETAHAIPYDELTTTGIVPRVQAHPSAGLADSAPGGGWTIRRRGITYTVSLGVCSVDDPADGVGVHVPASFCASGGGVTTPAQCRTVLGISGSVQGVGAAGAAVGDCGIDLDLDGSVDNLVESLLPCIGSSCTPTAPPDQTPDDYKRIVSLVRWDRGTGARYALQSATIPNPGISTAPVVTTLTAAGAEPVTAATSVLFTATTNRPASTVAWYLDGTHKGTAAGAANAWSFTWNVGAVGPGATGPLPGQALDGSYVVAAKAFDAYGLGGAQRAVTIRLNRNAPYAPKDFRAGRNGTAVDFEWSASAERDVAGYRVYRKPLVGADVEVCELTKETACRDTSPPAGSVTYYAVAVDRHPVTNAYREGTQTAPVIVGLTNNPPSPPSNLSASSSSGNTVLLWSASPGDPDPGDGIDHYRIYRDGVAYADRFDRTATGTELTFTDTKTGGTQHSYWVTAVDGNLGESAKVGPATR